MGSSINPITYHQKLIFCGKAKQCQTCLAGKGHGPYWYAYQTINGRTVQKYIGKHLPDGVDVQAAPAASAAYVRLLTLGQVCLEIRARGGSEAWYPLADTIWREPGGTLLGALASAPERALTHEQAGELLGNADVPSAIERLLLEPAPRTLRHHTLAAHLIYVSAEQIRLYWQLLTRTKRCDNRTTTEVVYTSLSWTVKSKIVYTARSPSEKTRSVSQSREIIRAWKIFRRCTHPC